MSRTRKDRPFWVRSNDPSERRDVYHSQRSLSGFREACWERCTVETSVNTQRSHWKEDHDSCGYIVVLSHNWLNTPDRRELFHGPQRLAERVYTQEARDAYNSGDEGWDDEGVLHAGQRSIKQYWNW